MARRLVNFRVNLSKMWNPDRSLMSLSHRSYSSKRVPTTFKAKHLQVIKTTNPKSMPSNFDDVQFGSVFTDHMLTIEWTETKGWSKPIIQPLTNFNLHPASCVLHYANELFEGMKAYRSGNDEVLLFRPYLNMDRFYEGALNMSLPTFSKKQLLKCIYQLVDLDRRWVPTQPHTSLYIRPTLIGTEASLGLRTPRSALLFCILSPVGPYFSTGTFQPVSLDANPTYTRACKGGFGRFKFGSNYGPTLYAYEQAKAKGCNGTLWLYGEDDVITEAGTMNVFTFWDNEIGEREIATMGLEDGLILPGVTRQSIIEILRLWNFKVSERDITMKQLEQAISQQRVYEMFGTGTASVVAPINRILYHNRELIISGSRLPLATALSEELHKIQYGRIPHEWSFPVEPRF